MNSLSITSILVVIFWVTFFVYWLVSARKAKKNVPSARNVWAGNAGWRLLLILIVIVVINLPYFRGFFDISFTPVIQYIGVVLCGAGIAFAIWARHHLGRNWSSIPTMKVDHELVTSGPYRFVRHPIYTGAIAATLGSTLATGPAWIVITVCVAIMFISRIPVEEKFMMQLFPDTYPAYKARTKALIPFVW